MFTGIITDIGRISKITSPTDNGGDTRFDIETAYATASIDIGASIACHGVCLTVIEKGKNWFAVEASQETLTVSTAKAWAQNTRLNLERALCMGDELGGHMVGGHVDAIATIAAITSEGASRRFTFTAPTDIMPLIAPKGSITLDGVSLTVNQVQGNEFGVNIIAHTQAVTSFGTYQAGDEINLEVDMLARYVARQQITA